MEKNNGRASRYDEREAKSDKKSILKYSQCHYFYTVSAPFKRRQEAHFPGAQGGLCAVLGRQFPANAAHMQLDRDLLKAKGRGVSTARVDSTVLDVCAKLASKKIGAIVVTDNDGRVTGIISERDIVRVIAQGGAEVLSTTVGDVMTRNVITCAETATLNDIMTIMTHGRFRHLPVVDGDGKLAGIISIGDVVKLHVGEISMEADAMRDYIASH